MCGIVGALAQRDVSSILLEGLNRLDGTLISPSDLVEAVA